MGKGVGGGGICGDHPQRQSRRAAVHEGGRCPCHGVDTTGAVPKEEGVWEHLDGTKGPVRQDADERCCMVWNIDAVLSMEIGGIKCLSAACLCNVHFPYMCGSIVKEPK